MVENHERRTAQTNCPHPRAGYAVNGITRSFVHIKTTVALNVSIKDIRDPAVKGKCIVVAYRDFIPGDINRILQPAK